MDNSTKTQGMSAEQFSLIMEEVRLQPSWRRESDRAADYYDDNQIDAELAEQLKAKGMGPLITNLIKPTVNAVLGQEAKTRTDWRVVADAEEQQELAEALSAKLMEAERESRADRACSDAYAGQIKSGLHWVNVARESDPFRYKYRVEAVHRREIYWDWNARRPDLSDARYLIRQRTYNVDVLVKYMPEHESLIRAAGGGWPAQYMELAKEDVSLMHSFEQEQRIGMSEWSWRDPMRNQVNLYEVWYKEAVRGKVIDLPDGRTVEVDLNNPVHQLAIVQGVAKPYEVVYFKTRVSLWCGPHKLEDYSYGTKNYPYIPFIGYREDLTGVPYGIIRSMIPLQDEVNARRRKLLWLLSSKRVFADSDALDERFNSFTDLVNEVARPDAVVVMNPDRKNTNGVTIDDQAGLAAQQFDVMQEAKSGIQEVAGVFNAQLGRDSSASSGTAINSLVEQGNIALAEINDNYRFARMCVGEALLELILADMEGQEITVRTDGIGAQKVIKLNAVKVDPATGINYRENDTSKALVKVALSDVPSTPAYRAQQMTTLGEALKSLPPDLQAPLVPFYLESTDLPKRKEMADLIRKQLGLTADDGQPPDPEKQQLQQQLQLLQQQIQEIAQQGADKVAELEGKLQQTEAVLKDRGRELDIKEKELDLKEADSERKALLAQQQQEFNEMKQQMAELRQLFESQTSAAQAGNADLQKAGE